jgi:hypothetical protein
LTKLDRADFQAMNLGATDLRIIPEFAAFLDANGVLRVPPGHEGYVLYGPYLEMQPGWYQVAYDIDADEHAIFDIFAGGQQCLAQPAQSDAPVWIHVVEPAEGVEFRFSVHGGALTFRNLELRAVAAPEIHPDPSRVAVLSFPARPKTAAFPGLNNLWESVHGRSREAVAQLAGATEGADLTAWTEHFPRARVIMAWDAETLDASASDLRDLGLDIAAVRDCAKDDFVSEADFAERAGRRDLAARLRLNLDFPERDFGHPFLGNLAKGQAAIQFTGLSAGVALCPSPFTGAILASRHAVPVMSHDGAQCHIFHYFDEGTPFYLVASGFGGRKVYIYVPRLELILQIGQPAYDWHIHQPFIDLLRAMAARHALAYFDYLASETRPIILSGTLSNMGHYFWNDISGLVRYSRIGLPQSVGRILVYKTPFLGPEVGLEETRDLEIVRAVDPDNLFQTVIRRGFYCVRPTALRISPEAAAKIRDHAESRFEPEERAVVAVARKADLLIWFNLRAHNKVWLDQVEGAVALAERIVAEGRTLSLILDGMADCESMATEIRRRIPDGVLVINGFEMPLYRSICWAFACDAYVATIGSGLTLMTWIAGRPGVAHSERGHLGQLGFWSEVRPDVAAPAAPAIEDIRDVEEGVFYSDYNIDPARIVDLLSPQLHQIHQQRAGGLTR